MGIVGHFPSLPPTVHIMGGGDTKKSLEEVKADLVNQLADNARDLLKKVARVSSFVSSALLTLCRVLGF